MLPRLIINKKIVEKNIDFMFEKAKKSNTIFRPHFKTHQSIEVGKLFLVRGINKITVSSLRMAYFFAKQGFGDITIAIPVNFNEIIEINKLANKIKLNIILSDSNINKELLSKLNKKISIFVEIDVGYARSGINYINKTDVDSIINKLQNTKLNFAGFISHFGNTYSAKSRQEILDIYKGSTKKLLELKQKYKELNPIISIGDTPSCTIVESFMGINEIRPGNFVYYDLMQYNLGICKLSNIAALVKATIIARYPERNEFVIHCGAVHLSKEFIEYKHKKTFGKIGEIKNGEIKNIYKYLNIISLSQEHGVVKCLPEHFKIFGLYDQVNILPVHSCLTANLMKDCRLFE